LGRLEIPQYCDLTVSGDGAVVASSSAPRVNIWMGPRGTVSDMHTDPDDNLFCQVFGAKRVLLLPPEAGGLLHPHEGVMSNTATVDPRAGWVAAAAKAGGSPMVEATVRGGEALFIPKGWWHHVEALSNSASVSLWWS